MTPTYEELLKGATTWRKAHKGVCFILSHHGHVIGNECEGAAPHPGTWCYYLLIPEQMYPNRWADFACRRSEYGFEHHGPAFQHEMFDTEITWASSEPYYCRHEKRMFDAVKVGCDYNHLWHSERGYPDTFQSVTLDAIATIEAFLRANPDRQIKSDYSHRWGPPEMFYEAVNGKAVHIQDEIPDGWEQWKRPATEATADA